MIPVVHTPMPDVTVRAAGFADLPAIRQLYRDFVLAAPRGYPVMDGDELDALVRALAAQFLAPTPIFCLLGAWAGDRAVGFLGAEVGERAVGRPHRVVNVHWIYIVPEGRGQGIARRLIAAAHGWLVANHPDITHVEWFSAAGDPQWTRRGYTPFLTRYQSPVAAFVQPQSDVGADAGVGPLVPEPLPDLVSTPHNGSPGNGARPKRARTRTHRRTEAPRRSDAE